ncbi:hypothetical protein AJ80_08454 [Polytolypa hystricis UAMH7299]|uniref:Ferric oxidoreductase domain-containing protein n=1 Tax=Polytolypa hystricis (strain UAMH7299) TaxID=1447883 RepID=A0A2B7X7A0_POLH7|nr:hypothetical protein AJ80_08454 [Polytolypa hystricis UAMH7299]
MSTTSTSAAPWWWWPYHFISLTPSQIQERRDLLNLRGHYAQISALIVVVCVSVYRRVIIGGRGNNNRGKKERGLLRKPSSWLDRPPVKGWGETRREYLVAMGWLVLMVGISGWRTGEDYLHLTKSLAQTSFANIPLQILLSPKLSSPRSSTTTTTNKPKTIIPAIITNPISTLTTIPPARLTPYHRLIGRIIITPLLSLHAILYLAFFAMNNHPVPLLPKRLQDADVQWGIMAVTLLLVMLGTSAAASGSGSGRKGVWRWWGLRRRVSRDTFYALHVSLVLGLMGAVYAHVSYARRFVVQGLAVYAVDVVAGYLF